MKDLINGLDLYYSLFSVDSLNILTKYMVKRKITKHRVFFCGARTKLFFLIWKNFSSQKLTKTTLTVLQKFWRQPLTSWLSSCNFMKRAQRLLCSDPRWTAGRFKMCSVTVLSRFLSNPLQWLFKVTLDISMRLLNFKRTPKLSLTVHFVSNLFLRVKCSINHNMEKCHFAMCQ